VSTEQRRLANKAARQYIAAAIKNSILWRKKTEPRLSGQAAEMALENNGPIANPNDVAVPRRPIAAGRMSPGKLEDKIEAAIGKGPPQSPVAILVIRSH
jgi:hypothetical protein